jgi:hypothetical protein
VSLEKAHFIPKPPTERQAGFASQLLSPSRDMRIG